MNALIFIGILASVGITLGILVYWIRLESRRMSRLERGLCLSCGYDLRGSTDRCPECGCTITHLRVSDTELDTVKLREVWPEQPATPMSPEDGEPVSAIYHTSKRMIAELLAEQLRSRGVWSMVRYSDVQTTTTPSVSVVVPAVDISRAREIVSSFRKVPEPRAV